MNAMLLIITIKRITAFKTILNRYVNAIRNNNNNKIPNKKEPTKFLVI